MITETEVQQRLEGSVYPRVTEDGIRSKIHAVRYLTDTTTTICIIEMTSGFKFIGHSTPASSGNYDAEIGEHYAYKNAFQQIWSHEGYLLRESFSPV